MGGGGGGLFGFGGRLSLTSLPWNGGRERRPGCADLSGQVTFALSAAVLVKEYGVYAKHSGMPEIKTVLGGFVIRRFLGLWTLITKSLGLVRFACPLALRMVLT